MVERTLCLIKDQDGRIFLRKGDVGSTQGLSRGAWGYFDGSQINDAVPFSVDACCPPTEF